MLNRILHAMYMIGYKGFCFSRPFRRMIAKTQFHRSWLAGHMGIFIEDNKRFGVKDRMFVQDRKRQMPSKVSDYIQVIRSV